MSNSNDAIAQFLARGGEITRCDPASLADQARATRAYVKADKAREADAHVTVTRAPVSTENAAELAAESAGRLGGRCIGFDEYGDAVSR